MNRFDWTKCSAIAEILGAVAVVITLLYLSVQTRYLATQTEQSTAATEAAVRQEVLATDQELIFKIIEYPALNRRTNLTDEERVQVSAQITAMVRTRENYWLQRRNGVLDDETWISYRNSLASVVFASEYGRAVWREFVARGSFDEGFTSEVDEWVAGLDIVDRDTVFPTPDVGQ